TLDIKVNGDVVGKIAPDSYFFIDRKPGTYTLRIEPPFDFTYFEADVQVAAGGTYYYSVNSRGATVGPLSGGGLVTMNPTPTTGPRMEAKEPESPAYNFAVRSRSARSSARRRLSNAAATTPNPTNAIMIVQIALISGFTPSRTSE